MYKEYQKRGGKLSREVFDKKLEEIAHSIRGKFHIAPSIELLRKEALEAMCNEAEHSHE